MRAASAPGTSSPTAATLTQQQLVTKQRERSIAHCLCSTIQSLTLLDISIAQLENVNRPTESQRSHLVTANEACANELVVGPASTGILEAPALH